MVEALRLQNALIDVALAFNYFAPVRSAMEMSQLLLQAIPIGGSPLLQLPGFDASLIQKLRLRKEKSIYNIQGLLSLGESERRKALATLDDKTYSQAINIAKQIPILVISNVHFKGMHRS